MQKQLHCQSVLLIHDLCFICSQKESEVAVTGNTYIQPQLHGVIEDTSSTNAILRRSLHHPSEIHHKDNDLPSSNAQLRWTMLSLSR